MALIGFIEPERNKIIAYAEAKACVDLKRSTAMSAKHKNLNADGLWKCVVASSVAGGYASRKDSTFLHGQAYCYTDGIVIHKVTCWVNKQEKEADTSPSVRKGRRVSTLRLNSLPPIQNFFWLYRF